MDDEQHKLHETKFTLYDSYDARITALEVGIKGVGSTIHELKSDIDSRLEAILASVNVVRMDLQAQGKTQWPTYIAAMAVGLVIVGMVGSGYVRDQGRTEKNVEFLLKKFAEHDADPGIHFALRERVLNHEDDLGNIHHEINSVRTWMEKHAEGASSNHVRAEEQIRALEKIVDQILERTQERQ